MICIISITWGCSVVSMAIASTAYVQYLRPDYTDTQTHRMTGNLCMSHLFAAMYLASSVLTVCSSASFMAG